MSETLIAPMTTDSWVRVSDASRSLTNRLQGVVYLAHNPKWSYTPTSGASAARHGGRFNPPRVGALYASMSYKTAFTEA
jgi:RES domain-containing protein